jgi:riboflavin kinase/FMN adenylyltransferase
MEVVNIKNGIEVGLHDSVLAIGNFDGVHKGHQQIIKTVIETARNNKKPAAILTFEPHPISLFSPQVKNYRITSFEQKCKIAKNLGLDCVFYAEFNDDFSKITAADFVLKILKNKIQASQIYTGDDFIFGHNREGDFKTLQKLCAESGMKYNMVSEIRNSENRRFSSSAARDFIRSGNMPSVLEILGHNFEVIGKVIEGNKKGREIGFPTANIDVSEYILPKFGVYKVVAKVLGSEFKAIANIGVKPTFGENNPLLEVHIPKFSENIYGKTIAVEFIEFIRDERKFDSVEDLKHQIELDLTKI